MLKGVNTCWEYGLLDFKYGFLVYEVCIPIWLLGS